MMNRANEDRYGIIIEKVDLPNGTLAKHCFPRIGYSDAYQTRLPTYLSADVDAIARNIILSVPLWIRTLMALRNRIASLIGQWWLKGQWTEGGEEPTWSRNDYHVHYPNRLGDRLYVPMWYGGFAIVDISDITKPQAISHVKHKMPSPCRSIMK